MTQNAQIDRPWAVFRCGTPNVCIARFRSRSDADGYSVVMRSMMSSDRFLVAYDIPQIPKEEAVQG